MGCTTDIEKRKEDHKTNATYKFGRAVQEVGYDKFQFGVLEEIKFSDWNEIFDIEQNYMIQYDSTNNGWNTRINKTRYSHITYSDEPRRYRKYVKKTVL